MSVSHTPAAMATAAKPTRVRFGIMVLLFITVVINYLDRSNLSIAAPAMAGELGIDPAEMGLVLSAFGWTYAICQIPGGWFVDKVSPRILYPSLIVLWSIATVMLGFAYSVPALIALRLAIGAMEAPSYPINNRVVTAWFPEGERATAIGFYTSGQFVGLAFLTPVLIWIQTEIGWHMVFVATGGVGIAWGLAWYVLYREPREHRSANPAEIELIRQGGGLVDLDRKTSRAPSRVSGADLRRVLSSRKLWGVYLGQFCLTSTLWFFLTWFPTYLVQARGMDFVKAGFLASLPFLAAFVGVLCSGVLSDALVRRGASLGFARKAPIVTGLLLSIGIIGANFVDSPAAVIAFLTLAFFGNGLASITWSLVSAIAPQRLLGLTGGVFNFVGNLSGITVPIVVGYLARDYGFSAGLTYVAALALIGALSYIFVVGKVERLPDTESTAS
ncbi:D-galactonate transporter [Roseomonas mucosa]|jgi:MFS transporter, ACS family, D-galactonate transporter|uniref:MFS transporter n=1 Tax=Roseomonas TaxID=125216 RepID=UPI000959D087|nr:MULTISPECIES: MFS transporter [Roseomonas]ATR21000.1 MFS transporter [Roseomonas sp. FDAARGOS_362]USQ70941.1 MFS transporter [Roseomonas mucosa]UZO96694.1 D-galactonate transporter [Roseomonas mucosa]GAV34392.1 D-galactonate transporter [Roseomonas sp. TAS13]